MWFFYNILFVVGYLFLLPRYLFRMLRRGGYRRGFMQRFGVYAPEVMERLRAPGRRCWIHAVSVGEIQVALRFMAELRARAEGIAFVLTTTTSTAHALAEKKIGGDLLLYFPLDLPCVVRRVLAAIRPSAIVFVESELWPNLARIAAGGGVPLMLLNGRISNRSYRGYRLVRPLVRRVLGRFAVCCAQSGEDAGRLASLGAPPGRVFATGSAKYDISGRPAEPGEDFKRSIARLGFATGAKVVVGGSTWPGEEGALAEIYMRLRGRHPNLRLVLAPRHAERRGAVAAELARLGLGFALWSESRGGGTPPRDGVLLVDTTGELGLFYSIAAVAFVGKSLTAKGGQNPIEPAARSKAVVFGPHMDNFTAICDDFLRAGAAIRVSDAAELEQVLDRLLEDDAGCTLMGARARALVTARTGAVAKSVDYFMQFAAAPGGGWKGEKP